jgi:hypothetical protein
VVGLRQEKQPLKLMISDLFPEKLPRKLMLEVSPLQSQKVKEKIKEKIKEKVRVKSKRPSTICPKSLYQPKSNNL